MGDTVISANTADIKPGNSLPLRYIPLGTAIHNVELKIGAGGQLVRSAGGSAQLMAKEGDWAHNRGVGMNPVDHPMGGGEGRSSGGRHPCSPWGMPTKGYKTRKNKSTDKFIVRRRGSKG